LSPFIAHRATLVDEIGDGHVGRRSTMKLQESFDKKYVDVNDECWKWDCMMNVDANMDDLKYYARTSNILKYWNPPIPSRKLSSLTMSNFDAYGKKLKTFQRWPHSLLTVWGRWKKFVMGLFEFLTWGVYSFSLITMDLHVTLPICQTL